MKTFTIQEQDLPIQIELVGKKGSIKKYLGVAATKAFGLALNAITKKLRTKKQ